MNTNTMEAYREKDIDKLKKFQLPHGAKKVGWVIACIAFVALFLTTKDTTSKLIVKYSLLIGLLIISISKEEIEDELVKTLRMHSFTFAFIFAVIIAISNPLFSYMANFLFEEKQEVFSGIGDWMILWLLLSIQVLYFEKLKWMHK